MITYVLTGVKKDDGKRYQIFELPDGYVPSEFVPKLESEYQDIETLKLKVIYSVKGSRKGYKVRSVETNTQPKG